MKTETTIDEFGNERCAWVHGIHGEMHVTYVFLDANRAYMPRTDKRQQYPGQYSRFAYTPEEYFKELYKRGIITYERLFEELL